MRSTDRWLARTLPVLAVAVAGATLRLIPVGAVFWPGAPVRLVSGDCEYHMLRVDSALEHGCIAVFDPDLDFPRGAVAIWPPGFDWAAALFVRAVRVVRPGTPSVNAAAFFPVLLGTLFTLAVLALARVALPARWALAAALWAAAVPGHLLFSQVGHLDQHVAEALLVATATALVARAVRARHRGAHLALAGVVLGIFPLVWQGGIYLAPVLLVALAASRAVGRERPQPVEVAALLAPATLIAAAGTWLTLRGEPEVPFTFVSISWFQPAFLALVWAAGALFSARREGRALTAVGVVAGVASFALAGEPLLARIADGLCHLADAGASAVMVHGGYLRYPRAWLAVINEYRPLWPPRVLLADGGRLLTPVGLVALPVALALWTRAALRWRSAVAAVLVVTATAHLAMTLAQRRYAYDLAIFVALAVPAVVRFVLISSRARWLVRSGPALAAALVLVAAPFWRDLPGTVQGPSGDAADFLERVRAAIPPPPRDVAGRAAWGVMTPWALGHPVRRWTGLPTSADGFGYGFEDQARLWLARSDGEALTILERRRARYVLTTRLEPVLPLYAHELGLEAPADDAFGLRLHRGQADPMRFRLVLDSRFGDVIAGVGLVPRWRLWEVTAAP